MIIKYDNKAVKYTNKWVSIGGVIPPTPVDPLNPLGLPPYTIRVKFIEDSLIIPTYNPSTDYHKKPGIVCTQVSSSPNVWDITYENPDWSYLFYYLPYGHPGLTETWLAGLYTDEILGANTTNVTNMSHFYDISESIYTGNEYFMSKCVLFDTSNVTDMSYMFYSQRNIPNIPLFNTSKVTNMDCTFGYCFRVESGALALYQQASAQTTPPTSHTRAFYRCGSYTTTGSAELEQIPSDWK